MSDASFFVTISVNICWSRAKSGPVGIREVCQTELAGLERAEAAVGVEHGLAEVLLGDETGFLVSEVDAVGPELAVAAAVGEPRREVDDGDLARAELRQLLDE